MRKRIIGIFIFLAVFFLFFRTFCGIFVIQPIGAVPKGTTIVYWRFGMENMPFIGSADGILQDSEASVSLLSRGLILGAIAKPLKEREIIRFGYSETLYLWSTDGVKYEK